MPSYPSHRAAALAIVHFCKVRREGPAAAEGSAAGEPTNGKAGPCASAERSGGTKRVHCCCNTAASSAGRSVAKGAVVVVNSVYAGNAKRPLVAAAEAVAVGERVVLLLLLLKCQSRCGVCEPFVGRHLLDEAILLLAQLHPHRLRLAHEPSAGRADLIVAPIRIADGSFEASEGFIVVQPCVATAATSCAPLLRLLLAEEEWAWAILLGIGRVVAAAVGVAVTRGSGAGGGGGISIAVVAPRLLNLLLR